MHYRQMVPSPLYIFKSLHNAVLLPPVIKMPYKIADVYSCKLYWKNAKLTIGAHCPVSCRTVLEI